MTQDENMMLDMMIDSTNSRLNEALGVEGDDDIAVALQLQFTLLRKLRALAAAQPESWKVLPSPARVTGEMLHQAFPEIPGEPWPLPAGRQAVWERFAERVNARLAGEQP